MACLLREQCSCEKRRKVNALYTCDCLPHKGLLVNMSATCAGCYRDLKDHSSLRECVTHFFFPARPLYNLCAISYHCYVFVNFMKVI